MPWPQDAYVGQKVVCINIDSLHGEFGDWHPEEKPELGAIYTIADIWPDGILGLTFELVEIKRSNIAKRYFGLARLGYGYERFRPIQSTETSMSILRKLQNPTNHYVRISEDA